jgi:hypothetical protein
MLEYFRHNIIKMVVTGFGTLFNDIWVAKYDANGNEVERFKVPLSYGPKQKFITRLEQETPELIRHFEMYRPRMGYELTGISYDGSRKLTTTRKSVAYSTTEGEMFSRFERVPYNLTFQLHVVTKNTDEALQILEQILPYFGPDFSITFKNFPLDAQSDVPISIGNVSFTENYEGNFDDRKSFTISISFVAKINLYGPVNQSKVITRTDVNFLDYYPTFVEGVTTTATGYEIPVFGAYGATFATVTVGVTGGATAGSIGVLQITGTPGTSGYSRTDGTYTVITEYPD